MIIKKFHGGLKVLLLLLFIIPLSTYSTCYALTPITEINKDFLQNVYDTAVINCDYTCSSSYLNSVKNSFSNFIITDTFVDDFISACNYLNVSNIEQLIFFMQKDSSTITVTQNNNTIGNNLPFFALLYNTYDNNFYYYNTKNVNSSKSYTSGSHFAISLNNNNYTISQIYTITSTSSNSNQALRTQYSSSQNITIDNNSSTCFIPGVFGFGNQSIYLNLSSKYPSDSLPYWNTNKLSYIFPSDEPEEPSGDSSTGGTGTITNNSGDTTGKIDLSGIEQGIGNIQNQISGDTQKIIENQNTIAEQQHEDLTSYNEDVADDGVNNLIDNIQDTLSGDLSNSEIFGALENTEQGFLDLIAGQASDFEVHWSDVYYNNVKLIPARSG